MTTPTFSFYRRQAVFAFLLIFVLVLCVESPLCAQETGGAEAGSQTKAPESKSKIIAESLNYSRMGDHEKAMQLMEDLYQRDPNDLAVKIHLLRRVKMSSMRMATGGKQERAYELYLRCGELIREIYPDIPEDQREAFRLENLTMLYNESCSLALKDNKEAAMSALKVAIDWGFKDLAFLMNDNDMASIVDGPELNDLIGDAVTQFKTKARAAFTEQMENYVPVDYSLELMDMEKNTVNTADYKGKLVVITFWSTGNLQSRKNIETLKRFQKTHGSDDIVLLAVACEKTRKLEEIFPKLATYFSQKGALPFTCLVANKQFRKQLQTAQGFPLTMVLNQEGQMQTIFPGDLQHFSLSMVTDILLGK